MTLNTKTMTKNDDLGKGLGLHSTSYGPAFEFELKIEIKFPNMNFAMWLLKCLNDQFFTTWFFRLNA